jgi:hypothetical protein
MFSTPFISKPDQIINDCHSLIKNNTRCLVLRLALNSWNEDAYRIYPKYQLVAQQSGMRNDSEAVLIKIGMKNGKPV